MTFIKKKDFLKRESWVKSNDSFLGRPYTLWAQSSLSGSKFTFPFCSKNWALNGEEDSEERIRSKIPSKWTFTWALFCTWKFHFFLLNYWQTPYILYRWSAVPCGIFAFLKRKAAIFIWHFANAFLHLRRHLFTPLKND